VSKAEEQEGTRIGCATVAMVLVLLIALYGATSRCLGQRIPSPTKAPDRSYAVIYGARSATGASQAIVTYATANMGTGDELVTLPWRSEVYTLYSGDLVYLAVETMEGQQALRALVWVDNSPFLAMDGTGKVKVSRRLE